MKKAEANDVLLIPGSILTATCVGALLAVKPEDFRSSLALHVYVLLFSLTSALGFSSLLSFTMISAKIRRLAGRSMYRFGDDSDDVGIVKAFHGDEWEGEKARWTKTIRNSGNSKFTHINQHNVHLSAREWYWRHYDDSSSGAVLRFCCPANASDLAFRSFQYMCVGFSLGLITKLFDVLNPGLGPACQFTCFSCAFILLSGFFSPLCVAHTNGSTIDMY